MNRSRLRNATSRIFVIALLACAAIPIAQLALPPAAAQTVAQKELVDAAKAAGTIGEQGDGYLGFVTPSTDPTLAAAAAAINAGRMNVYSDTATRTGVSIEAAGQATAQLLFARLPAGQYYKPLDGNWIKKS